MIEFGDGRQYTIKHTEPDTRSWSEPSALRHNADGEEQPSPLVSKEDRFGADISRNWPPEQSSVPPFASGQPPTAHDGRAPDVGGGKALFNERSNRFENASSYRSHGNEISSGGGRQHTPTTSPAWGRRDSHSESHGRWSQDRTSASTSQTIRRMSVSTQDGELSHSPNGLGHSRSR